MHTHTPALPCYHPASSCSQVASSYSQMACLVLAVLSAVQAFSLPWTANRLGSDSSDLQYVTSLRAPAPVRSLASLEPLPSAVSGPTPLALAVSTSVVNLHLRLHRALD